MPDFLLEPDDHESLLEPSRRQLRLTTGLADSAAVPAPRRARDHPPCLTAPQEGPRPGGGVAVSVVRPVPGAASAGWH